MADIDPISDDTPRKRQRLDGRPYDPDNDSGDDLTSEDFNTVATVPLASQKRKLTYPANQFHADLANDATQRATQNLEPYTTQPTQSLASKPQFHSALTQPTQPLPPNASTPPPTSDVQVHRSSPTSASPSTRAAPEPISRAPFAKPSLLASAMAPPGTTFRRPQGVQAKPNPAMDVDSDDDPPVEHSSGDEETQSALRPTNFRQGGRAPDSTPKRGEDVVRESPLSKSSGTGSTFASLMSEFRLNAKPRQVAVDDMAGAYASSTRKPRPQQHTPTATASSAGPPAVTTGAYNTIDDVEDYALRRKVREIQAVWPQETVQRCMTALQRKKANVEDASDWLAENPVDATPGRADGSKDELASATPVPKRGVAVSRAYSQQESFQPARPAAKQGVKAPTQTIAEKYRASQAARKESSLVRKSERSDEDDEDVQPRRRLQQGRKIALRSPSPQPSPPQKSAQPAGRLKKKKQTVVISDDEESLSGGDESADSEEEAEDTQIVASDSDVRLLEFFNSCSVRDVVDLSNQPEESVKFVLDQRPFDSLDAIANISKPPSGKSRRRRPIGEKIVEVCGDMWRGYDAVDELVNECERIGKPIQEALKGWGVGSSGDGELQLMNLDEAHDSGIGTPASSCPSDDGPRWKSTKKGKFLAQPESMNSEVILKDYQLVGLNWLNLLWSKKLSCILADDMGLGKTCQVIAFLAHLQQQKVDGVHLVVVPGSTLENWLREFARFAPELSVRPYYGSQNERAELRESIEEDFATIDVIITTYDIAVKDVDNAFLRKRVDPMVCVYDEAHALRNPKAQRYENLVRIPATFKVLLTGTPLQNNLQELVAILAFIMPGLFDEKKDELQYIFQHKATTKDADHAALLSAQRIAKARSMMTPFILRRKKQQVLDLPTKHRRVEFCDMTPTQADYYADLMEEAQRAYHDKLSQKVKPRATGKTSSTTLMALREVAIHPLLRLRLYNDKKIDKIATELLKREWSDNTRDKVISYLKGDHPQSFKGGDFGLHRFCEERRDYLSRFMLRKEEWMDAGKVAKFAELITSFASSGDRTLIFSQFTTMMDILEAVLETLDIKFVRLDGSTDMTLRQDLIDKFHADTSIPVFMLSTKAGGAGVNLACANRVIIFDSGFNPQDDIQAENRAHRVGQTRPVQVVRLVTRGTIEEQIHALGESKLALDERVAGEGASATEEKQAESEGQKAVEEMLFAGKRVAETKGAEAGNAGAAKSGTPDIRDAFKAGLEGSGVKVASKQAQF